MRVNVDRRVCLHRSTRGNYQSRSRQRGVLGMHLAVLRCFNIMAMLMLVMRSMRHFAQIKLRKKDEYKRLNEGHKNAQRHQQ